MVRSKGCSRVFAWCWISTCDITANTFVSVSNSSAAAFCNWPQHWKQRQTEMCIVPACLQLTKFRLNWYRFDLRTVRVDFVECLMRFLPTEAEVKLLRQYERDRKPLEALSDEDRFMMQFSRIERLSQRMTIMTFMGNFADNVQMLTPVRQTPF